MISQSSGVTNFGQDNAVDNLALDTTTPLAVTLNGQDNQTAYKHKISDTVGGKAFTISFKYKLKDVTKVEGQNGRIYCQLMGTKSDGSSSWHSWGTSYDVDLKLNEGVCKIPVTNIPAGITNLKFGLRCNYVLGEVTISEVMVALGESFPTWKPAKADNIDYVRFWAGASYENRNSAPFKVFESGKIVASEGEFGGTFTGELSIGNILIKDTNTTSAEFSIKTNNNATEVIRLTDNSARFDVDFSIGNMFKANTQTNEIDFGTSTSLDLNAKGTNFLEINKFADGYYRPLVIRNSTGGVHALTTKYEYGGLVLESSGTKKTAGSETPYDFKFARASSDEAVDVVVKGNLVVDNKITMADNNKIELVSVSGSNSGIDFMIR